MSVQLDLLKREWIKESEAKFRLFNEKIPAEFTTDDLHKFLDAAPHENYWGSLMATLKKLKLVRKIGYKVSARPSANFRPVTLWARN